MGPAFSLAPSLCPTVAWASAGIIENDHDLTADAASGRHRQHAESGNTVKVGAPVTGSDGERIGKVADVRGKYILVNVDDGKDTWLSVATFHDRTYGETVRFRFRGDEIAAFGFDEAPGDGISGPDSPDPKLDERLELQRSPSDQGSQRENLVSDRGA